MKNDKTRGDIMKKQILDQNNLNYQLFAIQTHGTNIMYYRNPGMVAWWSAAFPGFGHILLGQYIKGLVLFLWEMVVNQESHLNFGLAATLQGQFPNTNEILNPIWILLYIPIYLFTIWDSYRLTIDINHSVEAPLMNFTPIKTVSLLATGSNIFTQRKPIMALFWSFFSPGAGQFYLQRLIESIFFMIWFIVISYYSHFFEGILYLLKGELAHSNNVINIQWFMYMPSIFFFSAYNAYSDAIETNIMYRLNQTQLLKQKYQNPTFRVDFPKSH
jgi:TM2 domain-containing membrane protein YozV